MVNSHESAAMASVLLCLQLLGAVLALGHGLTDEPRKVPCVAPTRWEGRVVRFEQNSGWNTRSIVSYDAVKRRVRFLEEKKSIIPCKRFYEYIRLYADGVQYKIEQVSKACKKSPLNEPFDPFDIPANSTFEDDYIIGGPGDQLSAQEWSDRKPSRMLERWVGVYTVKNCYPVQETNIKKYNVTSSTRFFDIKLGIKDPSVFVPPSGCKATTPTEFSQC